MRRAAAAVLAALLLASGGACRRASASPSVLRIGHETDVLSLDPTAVTESGTNSILSNVYEGLVAFDRDMAIVPALAATWGNEDDRTWLIELRETRFHDGTPLTAEEVKLALDRAREGPSGVRAHLSTIESIDALDARRLRLRTIRRDPLLMNRLAYVLIPRRTRAVDGSPRLVGTGPYEIVRWEKGRVLETRAFDGYWKGRPAVDVARFVPVAEGDRSVEALEGHEVDVLRFFPEMLRGRVDAPGVHVVARNGLITYYLWFNTERAPAGAPRNPFADRRVRQAVSLAIDRDALARRMGSTAVPARQLVQKGVFGYVAEGPHLGYDPEAARALLRQAGYPDGFDTVLTHRGQVSVASAAGAVRDMLAAVGVRVRLEAPEWETVVHAWQSHRLPFFLAGWNFENGDATSFLEDCLMTPDSRRQRGSSNPGFSSARLDGLIEEQAVIFGDPNRLRHYAEVMRAVLDEMPLVPLYDRANLYGVADGVEWQPRLDGKLLAAEMKRRP